MLAARTAKARSGRRRADVTGLALPFLAIIAGFISFSSPCCLPLVPGYLSYVSALPVSELGDREAKRITVQASILFVAGFTAVFTVLGVGATMLGNVFLRNQDSLVRVFGVLIIAIGLVTIGVVRVPSLMRERRVDLNRIPRGRAFAFPMGMAFAAGWAPGIGPVLATAAATATGTVAWGALLLVLYSIGLGLPFTLGHGVQSGPAVDGLAATQRPSHRGRRRLDARLGRRPIRVRTVVAAVPAAPAVVRRARVATRMTTEVADDLTRWIALTLAILVAGFPAVLATRPSARSVAAKSPLRGQPAPEVTARTIDGTTARLATYRGRWVLVNFFATWCVRADKSTRTSSPSRSGTARSATPRSSSASSTTTRLRRWNASERNSAATGRCSSTSAVASPSSSAFAGSRSHSSSVRAASSRPGSSAVSATMPSKGSFGARKPPRDPCVGGAAREFERAFEATTRWAEGARLPLGVRRRRPRRSPARGLDATWRHPGPALCRGSSCSSLRGAGHP